MLKLNDLNGYRSFTFDRDSALERILDNTRLRQSEIISDSLVRIIEIIKSRYDLLINKETSAPIKHKIKKIEHELDNVFDILAHKLSNIALRARYKTFMLSYLSELFIVGHILKKDTLPKVNQSYDKIFKDNQKLYHRYHYLLSKLNRNIVSTVEASAINDDTIDVCIGKVFLKFPKKNRITRKRVLKRVKASEANSLGNNISVIRIGNNKINPAAYGWSLDEDLYRELLSDYKSNYLPIDRSPENIFDIKNPWNDEPIREEIPSDEAFYGWEVEKETTHDFVQSVRGGQIEAANQMGVDDFVWIAILDDKTCELCCEWRDGLLSSEIEEVLKNNKDLSDHCDAIVAPAHFNCRCTIAPASKDLETIDIEKSQKDFDEWIKSL